DLRLTALSHAIGLADQNRFDQLQKKIESINTLSDFVANFSVLPSILNPYLESINSSPITQKRKLIDIISRNEITINQLIPVISELSDLISTKNIDKYVIEEVEIAIKYSGYIEREKLIAEKLSRLENIKIQPTTNFNEITSLSIESRQKLTRIKPSTIGQASRIPGVSPADINVLLIFFGR
ncbi:MAG: tRNA uridine-5-carboxymethylaminomethyl(34) synthesis enzyme MnmG, partial [Rikenellaceae bacterium]